ncbi:ribosomal maturation YjgA family protein [Microbacterium sp. A588]
MPAPDPRSSTPRRLIVATLAVLTVAVGLIVHELGSGIPGDIAGDALYGVLIYLLFVFLIPRGARSLPAALAIIFCTGIEFLQLTDIPARAAAAFPPAVLVLGAGFDQRDLLVYAFAIIGAMIVDVAISRAMRRRSADRS